MPRSQASIEHTRLLSRQAKRRRTGTCADCGATTRYNGHPGKLISDLCRTCSARRNGEKRRGRYGPIIRAAAEFIATGPKTTMQVREHLGITDAHVSVTLHRLLKYGLIRRVRRGLYETTERRA